MARKPSPTTPDRPPTILSPYGEGYCRWCQFVVGLTAGTRVLEQHYRGTYTEAWELAPQACKGSYTPPPKTIPYASEKAAFRCTPERRKCPECSKDVPVRWAEGYLVYGFHLQAPCIPCSQRGRQAKA